MRLAIDSQIQFFAEEALAKAVVENKGKAGVCIVIHVKSAEILGWANYPFFNPNGGDNPDPKAARNRLALDVLEPGSTMKPILIAAALQEKVVKPETQYFCERGKWDFQGITTIRDTHAYDTISVSQILRWSFQHRRGQDRHGPGDASAPRLLPEGRLRRAHGPAPARARARASCVPSRPGANWTWPPAPSARAWA